MLIKIGQSIFILLLMLTALAQEQNTQKRSHIQNCKDMRIKNAPLYQRNPTIERAIQATYPANKHLFVQGLMTHDYSKVKQSISGNEGLYIAHIIIVSIFALLLIILIPILGFTRCCSCCSYCQTKNKQRLQAGYNGCQLKCPTFFILGLLLVLIVLCSVILKINTDFESNYHEFKCSLNLITHDMLEGAEYNQNMKFIGLRKYNETMNQFFKKMRRIKTRKCKAIRNTKKSLAYLGSEVIDLPNGENTNKKSLILTYSNPLMGSFLRNTTKVNSTFIDILGNPNITNTLLYNFSASVAQVNNSVFYISNQSNPLLDNLTKIDQKNRLVFNVINSHITNVEEIQRNIESTFEIVDMNVLRSYSVGSYVVISLCIVFSIGMAIVVACLFAKKKYLCRIGVYVCCGLLWAIGIPFFLIGIAFMLSNPGALYSCQYLRESLQSQQNFNKNIIAFKPKIPELTTISKCLSNSPTPDYYYNKVIDPAIVNLMLQIRSFLQVKYQGQNQTKNLNTTYNDLITSILKYRSSEIMDLDNPSMLEELRSISKTEDCFPDSWVPSLKSTSPTIPCLLANQTLQADINSCESIKQFTDREEGCIGCMDSSSIVQLFNDNQVGQKLKQILNKRYEKCVDSGRQIVVDNLHNLLGRYYYQKSDGLKEIEQKVMKLSANLKASVNTLSNSINPAYRRTIDWINTQPVLEPAQTSSLRKNMNCRVLGKGIEMSVDILCNSGITYVYNMRFLYPAAAVAILLICGLSVFFVYRHETQRKFEKMKKLQKQIKNSDDQRDGQNQIKYEQEQAQIQQNQVTIVIQDNSVEDKKEHDQPQSAQRLGVKNKKNQQR